MLTDPNYTGCSVLGSLRPEGPNGKAAADGRLSQYDVFDSLLAAFGNVMLYWFVRMIV